MRKIISYLMALVLVIGLAGGMGLSAAAEQPFVPEDGLYVGTVPKYTDYSRAEYEKSGLDGVLRLYDNDGVLVMTVEMLGGEYVEYEWLQGVSRFLSYTAPATSNPTVVVNGTSLIIDGGVYGAAGGMIFSQYPWGTVASVSFPYGISEHELLGGINGMDLTKVEDEDPQPVDILTPFTGTATSNTGQYEIAIAGFFDMELMPGDNVLALSEIQSNTIAVVAYNNNNGAKRTMTQTTIEEMTVTVSGGQVTQIYLMGRVQTSPGTLDRYSMTITL